MQTLKDIWNQSRRARLLKFIALFSDVVRNLMQLKTYTGNTASNTQQKLIKMKENAYRCDFCEALKTDSEVMGIGNNQDLYNPLESFKSVAPEASGIHFCLDCYHSQVLVAADNSVYRVKITCLKA